MLFLIFVVSSLLEIYVLISVGQLIGGFPTILLVIMTAILGSVLLKQQGFSILTQIQQKTLSGQTPAFELFSGLVVFISAILLLTPGFITDSVGLLGLMPWSRKFFIAKLGKNLTTIFRKKTTFTPKKPEQNKNNNTIEGEFWEG